MSKTIDRFWLDFLQTNGCPIGERKPEVLVREIGSPGENVLIERDSGMFAVLQLRICAAAQINTKNLDYLFRLPNHDDLHFVTQWAIPKVLLNELPNVDADLIVNQKKKNLRDGDSIEGLFLAYAMKRLPTELKHHQSIVGKLSIYYDEFECFDDEFQLRLSKQSRKKMPTRHRRNLGDELKRIEQEHEHGNIPRAALSSHSRSMRRH